MRMKSNKVKLRFESENGKDSHKSIVGSISFDNYLCIRNSMGKNRSEKQFLAIIRKVSSNIFPCKLGE